MTVCVLCDASCGIHQFCSLICVSVTELPTLGMFYSVRGVRYLMETMCSFLSWSTQRQLPLPPFPVPHTPDSLLTLSNVALSHITLRLTVTLRSWL